MQAAAKISGKAARIALDALRQAGEQPVVVPADALELARPRLVAAAELVDRALILFTLFVIAFYRCVETIDRALERGDLLLLAIERTVRVDRVDDRARQGEAEHAEGGQGCDAGDHASSSRGIASGSKAAIATATSWLLPPKVAGSSSSAALKAASASKSRPPGGSQFQRAQQRYSTRP